MSVLRGILLIAGCGWSLGKIVLKPEWRRTVCAMIPSVLFAGFNLVGYCFAMDSTPERIFASKLQMLKATSAFLGYAVSFTLILSAFFDLLGDKYRQTACGNKEKRKGYAALISQRPFTVSLLTLLLGYIPYFIASWPALFMGDCQTIIPQGFGIAELTTHHPVIYTIFLTGIIKVGLAIFHSWNGAIALFSLMQTLFFFTVMAFAAQIMIAKAGLNWKWTFLLLLYYMISPRISNCMFVITKDVWYAAFLLLFATAIYLISLEGWSHRNILLLVFASLGVLSFRKDGYYVLLLSFLVYLLFVKSWKKKMVFFLITTIGLHVLFNQVIYPSLGIEKGSIKEMLSIPLQQTARCAKYLGDSLTEEEKAEILDMFYFDSIEEMGKAYDPSLVDYIKYKFPEKVDHTLLVRYLRLWVSMGMHYPATYVNAFINNYFEYFYPGCIFMQCSYEWSQTCFERVNRMIGSEFSYPGLLDSFRQGFENLRESIFQYYPFRLINMPGTTTWMLIIWAFFLIYTRQFQALMLTIPLFVVMMICIASPCNGYYCRYQYPLLWYMPWAMLVGGNLKKSNGQDEEEWTQKSD